MMKEYSEGLVIGKFYPPHLGHHYLIDTALDKSDHVTVLVLGTGFDTISVEKRAEMIRSVHANSSITVKPVLDYVYDDFDSKPVWKAHSTIMINNLDVYPDAVFTSELYGDELADYFRSEHVCVDIKRKHYPISATAIRRDVYSQWRYIHPKVREYFRLKVVVMGAESTGTTTLCKALRKHYSGLGGIFTDTPNVPEYGRAYSEGKIAREGTEDIEFTTEDFWMIAKGQENSYELTNSKTKSPIIISDTDAVATEAFAPYYNVPAGERGVSDYGWFDATGNPGAIYLITDHADMPLTADGSRRKDIKARDKSTQNFIDTCQSYKLPYALISGTHEERKETAVNIIDKLLVMNAFMRSSI